MDKDKPGTDIGLLLKQRRLGIGLTLKQLSAKSNIHSADISRIERGERRATADFLIRIAYPLRYSKYDILVMAGFLDERGDKKALRQSV